MIEIKDYKQLLQYGDLKKICEKTGLTPYRINSGLARADQFIIDIIETYYEAKLKTLRDQIYDYEG
ncbi:MAG: hypothetical protein RLZ39_1654 [Bacteroidota bacterium]|jgi:hypothetical protein